MKIRVANPIMTIRRDGEADNIKRSVVAYRLHIEEWQLIAYLKWRAYHWYDMRFPVKLPGWRRLEYTGKLPEWIYNWMLNQDVKCYHLSQKCKTVAKMDIDDETAEKISDHISPTRKSKMAT